MRAINRTLLAALVAAALLVPVVGVAEAVGFSNYAKIAAVLAVVVVASFVDRGGFYGTGRRS